MSLDSDCLVKPRHVNMARRYPTISNLIIKETYFITSKCIRHSVRHVKKTQHILVETE